MSKRIMNNLMVTKDTDFCVSQKCYLEFENFHVSTKISFHIELVEPRTNSTLNGLC